jgi:hypothetical protein
MQRLSFRCRIVYSAMNQVFAAELCCLQQMSFRRRIVCQQRISFTAEMCFLQ